MHAAYFGLGALIAVVAVTGVAEDSVLEGEAAGSAVSVEKTISPQTVSISTDTVEVKSWQARSAATRHDLEPMPQNAHAITSSQTQIQIKTWSVPNLYSGGVFAVDNDTGDIYSVYNNKVQMVDVSANTRTEWIIPEDRVITWDADRGSVVVDGKYWFVDTGGDIQHLDPSTGTFTIWANTGCHSLWAELMADGQGNIYCDGYSGLIKLNPILNERTRVTPSVSLMRNDHIYVDSNGSIFASRGIGADGVWGIMQIDHELNSAKIWNTHEDRSETDALYVAGTKAYFMKHFPNRQVLGELDTATNTLREWSLPYQARSHVGPTSIVVDSNGTVFFEMSGVGSELHRFVPETAEFTKFNIKPNHLMIDLSDTIYMNLNHAVAAAT